MNLSTCLQLHSMAGTLNNAEAQDLDSTGENVPMMPNKTNIVMAQHESLLQSSYWSESRSYLFGVFYNILVTVIFLNLNK